MKTALLTQTEQAILTHLEDQQDRIEMILQELIGYQTVTPQDGRSAVGGDHQKLIRYIGQLLDEAGVDDLDIWEQDAAKLENFPGSGVAVDRNLSGMPILVATNRGVGKGRSLILNGHYDVVPAGEISQWLHAPFRVESHHGRRYGRGSCDMKGGIAAMLAAFECIKALNLQLLGDVIIQVVPDEEMTCMGTLACCQRGYTADAALIPEPTDMQVLIAMRGSFYGQLIVKGRPGHAEEVQPDWKEGGAVNPIVKVQVVLNAIEALNQEWSIRPGKRHPLLDPDMIVPVSISGGGDWAVTYPDKVTISFGVMTTSTKEEVSQELEAFILGFIESDPWLKHHPPEFIYEPNWHYGAQIDQDEPIVQLGLEVLSQLGYSSQVCGMGSLSDAIHLINYSKIPTISIGPAGQPAHMVDEYVEFRELLDLSKAIALILLRWCGVVEG